MNKQEKIDLIKKTLEESFNNTLYSWTKESIIEFVTNKINGMMNRIISKAVGIDFNSYNFRIKDDSPLYKYFKKIIDESVEDISAFIKPLVLDEKQKAKIQKEYNKYYLENLLGKARIIGEENALKDFNSLFPEE